MYTAEDLKRMVELLTGTGLERSQEDMKAGMRF